MGIRGISLAPASFSQCPVEICQIIGEFAYDGRTIFDSVKANLLMSSSASFIGSCKYLIDQCGVYLSKSIRNGIYGDLAKQPIIQLKFGQMVTNFELASCFYQDCCSKITSGIFGDHSSILITCKVFSSQATQALALSCMELFCGAGCNEEYDIDQHVRDILSLTIIHPSNDVALTII
ncbi:unnamed protein product, partial [Rotaria sp. Silwood2]